MQPFRVFSLKKRSKVESVTVASARVMPTITAVPPLRIMLYAWSVVSGRPMTSNA